ncbi:MAG: hypothetical protein QM813_14005 [Verrucomicrobiota bacterium]
MITLVISGCSTPRCTATVPFQIGTATIRAQVYQFPAPGPTYLNVHDDENTAVKAGKKILTASGGRLIELHHSGKRLVVFKLDGQTYRFDPNRIFSPVGVRATLERTKNHSESAQREIEQFTTHFLETFALDREPVIIALHNTGGGGLSINSYFPTGDKPTTASLTHVGTNRFAGDFFYVTDRRFFDYLQARDFNVTLQDDANVPDDGSASVYFARKGIPYINVEADVKHLKEQIEMVRVAREMMAHFGLIRSP